jgi:hypothetical protein
VAHGIHGDPIRVPTTLAEAGYGSFADPPSRPSTGGAPERALWAAILGDAVSICLRRTPASPAEVAAACRWIEEDDGRFAGFGWCCDLLGLNGAAIRARVAPRRVAARRQDVTPPTRIRWSEHC